MTTTATTTVDIISQGGHFFFPFFFSLSLFPRAFCAAGYVFLNFGGDLLSAQFTALGAGIQSSVCLCGCVDMCVC